MPPYPTQVSVKPNFFQEEETMCCSQEEIDISPLRNNAEKESLKPWIKDKRRDNRYI